MKNEDFKFILLPKAIRSSSTSLAMTVFLLIPFWKNIMLNHRHQLTFFDGFLMGKKDAHLEGTLERDIKIIL